MNEKYLIIGVLLVFLTAIYMVPVNQKISSEGTGIQYHSEVCKYLRLAGETDWKLIDCGYNLLTSGGKDWIKNLIGNWAGGSTAAKNIGTANTSTGCVDAQTLNGLTTPSVFSDIATNPIAGTYASIGTGNWTISKVFTANATINTINATALYNSTSEGGATVLFACNNFSSPVSLSANDQMNITWTIWVT
jgi:hypothetical protein